MCYSGKCWWEDYMGDCRFPRIDVVREKYPLPLCEIPDDDTPEERERLKEMNDDVREMVRLYDIKHKNDFKF